MSLFLSSLLLLACIDEILEAPYVLVSGMAEVRGVAPTARRTLLVATGAGILEIQGDGQRSVVLRGAFDAVAAHESRFYVLAGDTLSWGELPPTGTAAAPLQSTQMEGVRDIQAWCDGRLILARGHTVQAWSPLESPTTLGTLKSPVKAVTLLDATPCGGALALTETALWAVGANGEPPSLRLDGLEEARAVNIGPEGRIWLVHGTPPVLSVAQDSVTGKLDTVARYLGDPRDLHFGNGKMFPQENAYLADGNGTLDYVRVIFGASSAP